MKRKIMTLVMAFIMVVTLTGCYGNDYKVTMHSDGSGSLSFSYMIETQFYKMMEDSLKEEGKTNLSYLESYKKSKKDINDTLYYCLEKTVDFKTPTELEKIFNDENTFYSKFPMIDMDDVGTESGSVGNGDTSGTEHFIQKAKVTADSIEAYVNGYGEELKDYFMVYFSISFDKEINFTNGTLSEDKKTATWELNALNNNTLIQASTIGEDAFEKDKAAPQILGVKNKAYYLYMPSIDIKEDKGIKRITFDGKYATQEGLEDLDTWCDDGKHVITVEDFAANKTTKIFYIDSTAPTVKGVANNKTYRSAKVIKFSDKYGVKKATLNGKTIKSGKKVSKPGTYKVKVWDKAGNVKEVKFTIKKK